MTTVTDICNAALSHCGTRSKISSIDEGSAEANACLNHFAMVRDAALRAHDWNFARVTAALALLQSPPQRWAYKYAMPTDCLRIRRLNDVPLPALPEAFFEMAADKDGTGAFIGVILTDAAAVSAIYTARVTDPLRWDQGFIDAVTYGLASRICFELSGKEDRVRTLSQLWQLHLNLAAAEASNEGSSFSRIYLPEALAARGYCDP
jgi:hypothetical protein